MFTPVRPVPMLPVLIPPSALPALCPTAQAVQARPLPIAPVFVAVEPPPEPVPVAPAIVGAAVNTIVAPAIRINFVISVLLPPGGLANVRGLSTGERQQD